QAPSFAEFVAGHPVLSFGPSLSTKASGSFTGFVAATTASADSSLHSCERCPFRHEARSPQVRASTFDARLSDLRCRALATGASRPFARSPRSSAPRIRFLFISPTPSLHASSPRSVTLPQLRFASLTLAGSREDFHLWMDALAGRTNANGPSHRCNGPRSVRRHPEATGPSRHLAADNLRLAAGSRPAAADSLHLAAGSHPA